MAQIEEQKLTFEKQYELTLKIPVSVSLRDEILILMTDFIGEAAEI
jgi:hypothetical protein